MIEHGHKAKRPEWTYALGETVFREISAMTVDKIEYKWKFTGSDTSVQWLVLWQGKKSLKISTQVVYGNGLFEFNPNSSGLIGLTYEGKLASKLIKEIDDWEKKNAKERAEYERLKEKFG